MLHIFLLSFLTFRVTPFHCPDPLLLLLSIIFQKISGGSEPDFTARCEVAQHATRIRDRDLHRARVKADAERASRSVEAVKRRPHRQQAGRIAAHFVVYLKVWLWEL